MAAAAARADSVVVPDPRDTVAAKILRAAAKAPLNIVLVVLGALWIVPTVGLFLTSILPASALASKGWWQFFSKPSLATWSNYDALFHNQRARLGARRRRRTSPSGTRCSSSSSARWPATRSPGSTSRAATGCSSA